ncbi:amino acid permease [Colletotrichum gloeosporioides Cg-14]|uniref:Amino acid permease n=1 Tax=Colletotrichum gloeosporioides (strain Cg-14) TaxID=1237896 RepID=T0L486_COLGC|nr:amino acid permease [Colletotrichum gloeosporioides Cg-14]
MSSENVAKFGKSVNDAERDPSNLETSMSNTEGSSAETGQLKREFKERHVSMIAVAGAIGTGLIIGSGTGLVRGGPASLLIAYTIIGAVVFFIMTAVGEMATMLPSDKGFAGYATRFVDPALG